MTNSFYTSGSIELYSKAVKVGDYSKVKAFIEANPYLVNAALETRKGDKMIGVGTRAIHIAASNGRIDMVKFLLKKREPVIEFSPGSLFFN